MSVLIEGVAEVLQFAGDLGLDAIALAPAIEGGRWMRRSPPMAHARLLRMQGYL